VWCPEVIENLEAALEQPEQEEQVSPDEQAEKAPHTIIKLPPLPKPNWNERVYGGHGNEIIHCWFTDHQMREYARQAVCESEDAWQSRHTTPPRREWQGLTEEEIQRMGNETPGQQGGWNLAFARAIEQACKERNT
jgi:hypothetical protein